MPRHLGQELPEEASNELLEEHGIDVSDFWTGSITTGADAGPGDRSGGDAWA